MGKTKKILTTLFISSVLISEPLFARTTKTVKSSKRAASTSSNKSTKRAASTSSNKSTKRAANNSSTTTSNSKRAGSNSSKRVRSNKENNVNNVTYYNEEVQTQQSVDLSNYYSKDLIEVMMPYLYRCLANKYSEDMDGVAIESTRTAKEEKVDLDSMSLTEKAQYLANQYCESEDAADLLLSPIYDMENSSEPQYSLSHIDSEFETFETDARSYTTEDMFDAILSNDYEIFDEYEYPFLYNFTKSSGKAKSMLKEYIDSKAASASSKKRTASSSNNN